MCGKEPEQTRAALKDIWIVPLSITTDFYAVVGPAYPVYPANAAIAKRKPKKWTLHHGIWLLHYHRDVFILLALPLGFSHGPLWRGQMKFPGGVYFCHYGIVWNMQRFSWYEELVNFPINQLYFLFKTVKWYLAQERNSNSFESNSYSEHQVLSFYTLHF